MNYENHFKDQKDIEECKQYLLNTYGLNPYSLMITGDRFFETCDMNKSDFDRVYFRMHNDKRLEFVTNTKHYDFNSMACAPYKFDNFEKYKIRFKVRPNLLNNY